jgi:hypothetical protein
MESLNFEQKIFIKTQYNFLSNSCKDLFNKNDLENLHLERARVGVFINNIEKLFNVDFYKDLLPHLA